MAAATVTTATRATLVMALLPTMALRVTTMPKPMGVRRATILRGLAGAYAAPPLCAPGTVWIAGYNGVDGYCAVPPYSGAYWIGPGYYGGRFVAGYWGGPRGFVGGHGFRAGAGFAGHSDFRGRPFAGNNFRGGAVRGQSFAGNNSFRGGAQGARSFNGGSSFRGAAPSVRSSGGFSHGGGGRSSGGGQSSRGHR